MNNFTHGKLIRLGKIAVILLIELFFVGSNLSAQNLKKGFKDIAKNEIEDATKIFSEALSLNPNCPASNYAMAVINAEKKTPADYFKAYECIQKSLAFSGELTTQKDYKKLDDYVTPVIVNSYSNKVDSMLKASLTKSKSITDIARYLKECPQSKYVKTIRLFRDSVEFLSAKKNNTIEAYNGFMANYPEAAQKEEAIRLRNVLVFENVKKENTLTAYKQFVNDYPNAEQVSVAKKNCWKLEFDKVKQLNIAADYKKFIAEYPDADQTKEAKEKVELLEFNAFAKSDSIAGYKQFIKDYPQSVHLEEVKSKLLLREFKEAVKTNTVSGFEYFKSNYKDSPAQYLSTVDSLLNVRIIIEPYFPNAEKYKVAFIRRGNLWIMNEDGSYQRQVTHSSKVISLACKDNRIYYGQINGKNLDVVYFNLNNETKRFKVCTIPGKDSTEGYYNSDNYFRGSYYARTIGKMGWGKDHSTLVIGADFREGNVAGFNDCFSIDMELKQVRKTEVDLESLFVNILPKSERVELKAAGFFVKKTGNKYFDLYYRSKGQQQPTRISNVQKEHIDPNSNNFEYIKLPSGKIVYWSGLSCEECDIAHYAMFISCMDGTNQVLLNNDLVWPHNNYNILRCNGEFVEIKTNEGFDRNDLVSFVGNTNQKVVLAKDVEYFEFIPQN